jgi:transcriptional regulator with XRE-family HTH domain
MSGKSHPGNQPVLPREQETSPSIPSEPAWTVWCLRGIPRWSQTELAARSGIPESAISRYENGKQTPSSKTWAKLCATVGLPCATVDEVLRPAIRKVLTILGGTAPKMIGSRASDAEDWTDELLRALAAILRPRLPPSSRKLWLRAAVPGGWISRRRQPIAWKLPDCGQS